MLMPSPGLPFCLPSYPSLRVSGVSDPSRGGASLGGGVAIPHPVRSSEAQLSLHAFTLWSGGTLTCRAPTLPPGGSHLWWPLLSLPLTDTATCGLPTLLCSPWSPHACCLLAWSPGRRERRHLPPQCDHCCADTFLSPPALRTTTSVSFINSRLFRNKPSLYRTAPLQFTWGPLSPKPLFLLF